MTRRLLCVIAVCGAFAIGSGSREAAAQVCYPTFGYGNVGYSSGYSIQQAGWCGPRWGGWWYQPPLNSESASNAALTPSRNTQLCGAVRADAHQGANLWTMSGKIAAQ